MRVVFFGTPTFAAHVLEYLLLQKVNIVGVISKPDRPKGRSLTLIPTPVKTSVITHNPAIPLLQPEIVSSPEFADTLRNFNADVFIVVAYGEILKQHLLEMPHKACINLHASLLPEYRGAAPIQRCIIEGKKESGITIMHMVRKMDAGDMIKKVVVPIGPETTFGDLEKLLCEVGKIALLEVIHDLEKNILPRIPQDQTMATFAPKIELEDCQIDWNRPAQALHNLIRGVNPYPGAWCYVEIKQEKKRLKINRSKITSCLKTPPATLLNPHSTKGNLLISTQDHALELLEVQLEGKKNMTSEELTRGIPREYFKFFS